MQLTTFTVCLLLIFTGVDSAKILGIFPRPSRSHHILGNALLKELVKRGHDVTMISPYVLTNPPKNYHHVHLTKMLKKSAEAVKNNANKTKGVIENFFWVLNKINGASEDILSDEAMVSFLQTNPKFDVTILLTAINEAVLGVAHKVNSSIIAFSHIGTSEFLNYITGNPNPVAYVPHFMLPYSDEMNFLQRTTNTFAYIFSQLYMHLYYIPYQESVLRKFFPEAPSLDDLIQKIDLTLANSHFITETPRPYLPNVIQIGGFHLEEHEELSDGIEKYMNSSTNGVIYFSLGTNVKSDDLGENTIHELLSSFGRLEYDILWKFEGEIQNQPNNVKILKWVPQKAVLKHPNTKVFITHGGLGSTVEAIYYGIPMICIPLVGDQIKNAVDSVQKGIALKLEKHELNKAELTRVIKEITENSSYAETVKILSDVYRNQPISPMRKAMFWIEHVIKHGGANHLKCRAIELSWYQYMLIDVFAFIFLVVILFSWFVYYIVKTSYKCFCKDRRQIHKNKNE